MRRANPISRVMITSGVVLLASAGALQLAGPAVSQPRIITTAALTPQPDPVRLLADVKNRIARVSSRVTDHRIWRQEAVRKARLLAAERRKQEEARKAAAAAAAAAQAQAVQQPAATATAAAAGTVSTGGMSAFEACVIQRESGGDPTAYNSSSGASGLFGFLLSTWLSTGLGYTGGAYTAPVSVQEQGFQIIYARDGTAPWAPYDGC